MFNLSSVIWYFRNSFLITSEKYDIIYRITQVRIRNSVKLHKIFLR